MYSKIGIYLNNFQKKRIMKIYTKTGDTGTTALFGGTRVAKHHIRIESYGTVDELNSHIGLIRDQEIAEVYKSVLIEIQDRLFTVGAILATPPEKETLKSGEKRLQNLGILESDIEFLEKEIEDRKNKLTAKSWRGDLSKRGLDKVQWGDLKCIQDQFVNKQNVK